MREVRPVKPVAPYIGGKRNLAERIVKVIDGVEHDGYAEAFVGMAGVFLRRRRVPKVEVINDLSCDVSNFFRILQRHYVAFMEMMKFQLTTRAEFERLAATDPETLTDLERAARFLYLQRTAFGGKVVGRGFGVSNGNPGRFDVNRLAGRLEDLHDRLSGVVIERLHYADFLARYDRPGMLFYLDPPYWGCEGDYGKAAFARADFKRLAGLLKGLRGLFVLSINDVPEVRKVFSDFEIEAVETTYSIGGGDKSKRVSELIVTGPGAWDRTAGLLI